MWRCRRSAAAHLLEAVRQADTPNQEELDADLSTSSHKRLGLSDTVRADQALHDAMRRRQRILLMRLAPPDSSASPDAEEVFRQAGRFLRARIPSDRRRFAACCAACRRSSRVRSRCGGSATCRPGHYTIRSSASAAPCGSRSNIL